jgi:integrase
MSIKKVKNPGSNETKWEVRVYEDGRDSKRVSKRFDRRVDAEAWLLEFEQKKSERIRNPFSSVSFENRTFKEEAEYWLLDGENRFSAGHIKKSKAIVKEILEAFGILPIERISPEFLTRFQQSELKKGARPATINRKTEVVTAVLNNSVKHRRIPFNPTMGFRKLSKNQKEMDFWNKDEAESFLSFIDEIYPKGSDDRWVYAVYLLALNTGLRAGEIWGLRPQDILEGQRSITVKRQFNRVTLDFTAPKSKKPRVVPCNQVLLNELKSWIDLKKMSPTDTIFQNENGKPICHDNFADRRFQKNLKAWGGRPIRFHDMRHTATTLLIASGVDLKTVKEICGHADIATTMNYVHMVSGAIEKVALNFSITPTKGESKNLKIV